jgi:uncharacterized protein (TIGR02246 family)
MHKILLLRLIRPAILALGALAILSPLHADQGKNAVDHAQIKATIDANNAAVDAKNMEGILATFAADAVMAGPGGTLSEGKPALREAFQQFLAINPKVTVGKSELIQAGNLALYSYSWTISGKTPDGHPVEQGGLTTVVLRKQPDGQWLMVIDNPFADRLLTN